mmetsp:Transcript_4497/g.28609  ORF Transcript_4497/g.28609 Transcript_4497/m.28609 type:complete len:312 (+) Transcript_4497:335-1270(+)
MDQSIPQGTRERAGRRPHVRVRTSQESTREIQSGNVGQDHRSHRKGARHTRQARKQVLRQQDERQETKGIPGSQENAGTRSAPGRYTVQRETERNQGERKDAEGQDSCRRENARVTGARRLYLKSTQRAKQKGATVIKDPDQGCNARRPCSVPHSTERIHGSWYESKRRFGRTSMVLVVCFLVLRLRLASLTHSELSHGRERSRCTRAVLLRCRHILELFPGEVGVGKRTCCVFAPQGFRFLAGHHALQLLLHLLVALFLLVELLHGMLVCSCFFFHLSDGRFLALKVEHAPVLRNPLMGFMQLPQFVGEE